MASITYINISTSSCDSYASVAPQIPGPTPTIFLSAQDGTGFLRNTDYTRVQLNSVISVNLVDFAFRAWTTQAQLGTVGSSTSRFLESNSATSTTSTPARLASISTSTYDWAAALPSSLTFSGVNYTISQLSTYTGGTQLTGARACILQTVKTITGRSGGSGGAIVTPTYSQINYTGLTLSISGTFSSLGLTPTAGGDFNAASPPIQTGTSSTLPRFYLRRIPAGGITSDFSNAETYYRFIGGVAGETNIGDLNVLSSNVTSNIGHQFILKVFTQNQGTISETSTLSVYDGRTGNTRISDLTPSWNGTDLTFRSATTTGDYLLDITNPTDRTIGGTSTLLRNVSAGTYVYWTGYTAGAASQGTSMALRSYWVNNISLSELAIRTVFSWEDLTPAQNAPAGVPTVAAGPQRFDVYRWRLQVPSGSSTYIFYSKNAADDGGNLTVSSTGLPLMNEGWAVIYLTGETQSTGGIIGYVRNNKVIAVMREDGSLPATVGTAVTNATVGGLSYPIANAAGITITSSSHPASFRYSCIRCTTVDGSTNLCTT